MILIIANPHDVHARCVADELARQRERVSFLDTSSLAREALVFYPVGHARSSSWITAVDRSVVCLDEVKAVWYRRPHSVEVPPTVSDTNDRMFVQREWWETLEGLLLGHICRFVNPLLNHIAAVKPRQLEIAQRVGFRVPDTLITNDPVQVEEFLDRHDRRVIHKAMTAPPHHFMDTRRWSEADREALVDLALAPTVFQEEIAGPSDVRVTIIGEEIFAARIETAKGQAGLDSRLDLDAPCVPHALPAGVRQLLLHTMRELGLHFGTIDLKITEQGEYVFFEVNPQGQFLYIEILTGMPISSALARFLADG